MKISLDLLQIFFTSSMDIISITHELSKDYIENLRNSSYLKIGFIIVEIVCMLAEFNHNDGIFFRLWKFLLQSTGNGFRWVETIANNFWDPGTITLCERCHYLMTPATLPGETIDLA